MSRRFEEQAWFRLYQAGDDEAFARIVESYRTPVYSYLTRCGVREADRDDLFQEIFIRIHRASAGHRPGKPLHPWLFTIVANAVRSHLRKRRIQNLVFRQPSKLEPASGAPDAERVAEAREATRWASEAILRLPLVQREVLLLAGIERRPQKEVGQVLGLPLNSVKTHLRRARATLIRRWLRHQAGARDRGQR